MPDTRHDAAGTLDDAEALDVRTGDASTHLANPGAPAIDFAGLRASGRDQASGRWIAGCMPRVRTGSRTDRLLEVPALAVAHRERTDALSADLGGMSQLSAMEGPLVAELARLQLVTESLGADVLRHGVLTGKGRTRAAVTIYLQVLDRQQKLAQLLGLERRQKPAMDLHDYAAKFHDEGTK